MKKLIIVLLILLFVSGLLAQNYMEEIVTLSSEQSGDYFGSSIEVLDFNGDGKDDLAVAAYSFDIDDTNSGRLYIYFGKGEDFADSADVIIDTMPVFDALYTSSFYRLTNIGDYTGNGCDDLAYIQAVSYTTSNPVVRLIILSGSPDYVSTPIIIHEFQPSDGYDTSTLYISKLCDINGDGYDDSGISMKAPGSTAEYFISYGSSYELTSIGKYFMGNRYPQISGLGDINNDGFGDFSINHKEGHRDHLLIFYGGNQNDYSTPDLNLYDYHDSDVLSTNFGSLMPCGDWSNDEIDDFMAMDFNSNGIAVWFGADGEINPQINFYIEWFTDTYRSAFGDLNGNGKTDIVMSYPQFRMIRVYLGNQNGTRDFTIYHTFENYGWDIAIGDFTHDGYDDLAVGAMYNQTSRIWVYAGNPDLTEADPEVSVESVEVPITDVEFKAYPNPFNPTVQFEIQFNAGYNFDYTQSNSAEIKIFNLKGQLVEEILFRPSQDKQSYLWNASKQASGVYSCALFLDGNLLKIEKITLIK